MKPILPRLLGAVSLLAGAGLLVLEIRRFRAAGGREIWFWGFVGAMAVVLGLWELLARQREQ